MRRTLQTKYIKHHPLEFLMNVWVQFLLDSAEDMAQYSHYNIRIFYEDTDAGGVVFYANYLKYCERARSELVRHLGVSQAQLLSDGMAFMVKSVNLDYLAPARFEQLITVRTNIAELKRASIVFTQEIVLEKQHNQDDAFCSSMAGSEQVLLTATVKVACVNLSVNKPCAIPSTLHKELLLWQQS